MIAITSIRAIINSPGIGIAEVSAIHANVNRILKSEWPANMFANNRIPRLIARAK